MSERHDYGSDTDYQGWKNYPTWNVHLWLANDETSYYTAQAIIADGGGGHRGADDLREWVAGRNPLAADSNLYADILGWALASVDWDDVAKALVEADDEGGGDV